MGAEFYLTNSFPPMPSSGFISILQFGHLNCLWSHCSRQTLWNVWPQPGMTLIFSPFSKSDKQIEQVLYLNLKLFPFFVTDERRPEEEPLLLSAESADTDFFIGFSKSIESTLASSNDSEASLSNDSLTLTFARKFVCYSLLGVVKSSYCSSSESSSNLYDFI